mmetsp:Transcript_59805/g.96707  ORF Transcript_59805/g.96707 Transcript_59805/m.96707 type:complete len:159 (-) Transcript_59805:356-832(-)
MTEDPRLREQEWGNLQRPDKQPEQLRLRDIVGRFYYRFPQGESGSDVYDRVGAFWDSLFRDTIHEHWIRRKGPIDTYIIVTHGLTLRILCMYYFRWCVERFANLHNPRNCEHWVMEKDQDGHYHLQTPIRQTWDPKSIEDKDQTDQGDSAWDFHGMYL